MSLIKRRNEVADQVAASMDEDAQLFETLKGNYRYVLSTGSTLLDCAISCRRVHGGGIPTGIMVEIFGPSGSGKTALMMEILASTLAKKGKVKVLDPEGRIDKEYARIYGTTIDPKYYSQPDTVAEAFDEIEQWAEDNPDPELPETLGCDSTAALSTEMEMESEDKYGGKRAKDFSAGTRKVARLIAHDARLVVFTNQIRQSMAAFGPKESVPGGEAVKFYSSLRIRVAMKSKIEKKIKFEGKDITRAIGIESECYIAKSSVDNPYRTAPINIIFGYGIDDVRANLSWLKDVYKETTFGETFFSPERGRQSIYDAIKLIEDRDLTQKLRDFTIKTWNEIDAKFIEPRLPKARF